MPPPLQSERPRLEPRELEDLLGRAEISDESFCLLTGTNPRVLRRWRAGEQDIPIWVHPFLLMLTVDQARQLAEWTVDETVKRPDREGRAEEDDGPPV